MTDSIQRLDIIHEATFVQPAFAMLREFAPIMKAFYEELGTRFTINPDHISVTSANVLSDLALRFGLFNNAAIIELRPTKMSVRLPNITNSESTAIAKDVITLSHSALGKALPDTSLNATSFLVNIWIALEKGAEAVESIFERHAKPSNPINASLWGADSSRNSIRHSSKNDAEGWGLTVYGDPSLVPGAHLFLSIELNFLRHGLKPIREQIVMAEAKVPAIFAALGLDLPKETPGAQ